MQVQQAAGINYITTGHGTKPTKPIVCLHGIGGSAVSFQPQLDALAANYHLIAWNMPGYGGSVPLTEPGFPDLAEKLLVFLDALEIEKAHLCGHSIGGMIALETACLFPQRIHSLSLIGTTAAFGGRDDRFRETFIAARLKPLDDGMQISDLATRFVPEITGPIATSSVIAAATATMADIPEAVYRDTIRCLVTFNRRDDIARLDMPVCLIAGEHDQNAPARTMARMADKIPGAAYHVIDGAGHLINLEAASETNHILHSFYGQQQ